MSEDSKQPEVEQETPAPAEPSTNQDETSAADGDLAAQLAAAQAKADKNWDLAVRAQAELQNVQRRSSRDIENAHKYALEKFVNALLPIMDSLEQGLDAAGKSEGNQAVLEGMQLTLKMFTDTLGKFNVEVVDPQGEMFNPERHEAMSAQEVPDAKANSILFVVQKGYLLHGRLIRPARVIVAKAAPEPPAQTKIDTSA